MNTQAVCATCDRREMFHPMETIATRNRSHMVMSLLCVLLASCAVLACSPSQNRVPSEQDERRQVFEGTTGSRVPDQSVTLRASSDMRTIEQQWALCRLALADSDVKRLQHEMDRLYDAKLSTGFRNLFPVAELILRHGYSALRQGDIEKAFLLGKAARNIAPDFYPSNFFLSRVAWNGHNRSMSECVAYFWDGVISMVHNFHWGFRVIGLLLYSFIVALAALFLMFVVYLLVRHLSLLVHEVSERVVGGRQVPILYGAMVLLVVGTALVLPRFLYWAMLVVFLTSPFHQRWERRCVISALLFLCCMPWVLGWIALFLLPYPKSVEGLIGLRQGTWDRTVEEALVESFNQDPHDIPVLWALGLAHKRRGDVTRAEWFYRKALACDPGEARLWNNLGNVYYVSDRVGEAKDAYTRAISLDKGLCAPHYNLSQILRREFLLSEGTEEFERARSIDPKMVNYFLFIHAAHPNRIVIDEEPPVRMIWKRALRGSDHTVIFTRMLWNVCAGDIPYANGALFFMGLVILYISYVWLVGETKGPFRCLSCGSVVCHRCAPRGAAASTCLPCYQALYQKDHIPKDLRHKQLQRISRYRLKHDRVVRWASWMLPGMGHILQQEIVKGGVFLLVFLFCASWLIMDRLLVSVPLLHWPSGAGATLLIGILLLSVYVWVQRDLRKRLVR